MSEPWTCSVCGERIPPHTHAGVEAAIVAPVHATPHDALAASEPRSRLVTYAIIHFQLLRGGVDDTQARALTKKIADALHASDCGPAPGAEPTQQAVADIIIADPEQPYRAAARIVALFRAEAKPLCNCPPGTRPYPTAAEHHDPTCPLHAEVKPETCDRCGEPKHPMIGTACSRGPLGLD